MPGMQNADFLWPFCGEQLTLCDLCPLSDPAEGEGDVPQEQQIFFSYIYIYIFGYGLVCLG